MRTIPTVVVGLILGLGSAAPSLAESRPATVVELFTSQGCSSCPPANANLIEISTRPDVLVLSFAVTYWDRLGWKDTFGRPEYTDRQVIYEPALGEFGPFTPQMVVNGQTSLIGHRLPDVDAAIATTPHLVGPALDLGTAMLSIGAGASPDGGADIWRVTYDPRTVEVDIGRGENSGRTLAHTHVVHSLDHLGDWTGSALDLPVTPASEGLRTAILVQARQGGPILAAVTN